MIEGSAYVIDRHVGSFPIVFVVLNDPGENVRKAPKQARQIENVIDGILHGVAESTSWR